MNRWLALAKEPDDKVSRLPDTRPEPAKSPFCTVSAGCLVDNHSVEDTAETNSPAPAQDDDSPFQHGRSVAGDPCTWTGRIVSLDEWRRLSDWDRHGSSGRMFCSVCQAWVRPGTCPHCGGGQQGQTGAFRT